MTAVETQVAHDWRLVGPWWSWPRLDGTPAPGPSEDRRRVRTVAPQVQKYDDPDLVNLFLAAPQHRLAFEEPGDRVTMVGADPDRFPTAVAQGPRKLYLPSHHRQYLVVCGLHCDVAGFPHARRDDVCEAGFVVRRRTADIPGGPDGPVAEALRRWSLARRRLAAVERRLRTTTGLRRMPLERRREVLVGAEASTREAARLLARGVERPGSVRSLAGWVPAGVDAAGDLVDMPACPGPDGPVPLRALGAWREVEEQPVELVEAAFPLTPLVADPTRPGHDAAGESLYFGVVPTGSADVGSTGAARFDDDSDYEIRCFVRRHRPECPREGRQCRCPLTWSEPTETYRLAGHFDLEGCAHRPVTVQMPDLRTLQVDALRLGARGASGVRFSSPPESALEFVSGADAKPTRPERPAGAQVCSFAIPLITIIAFFVLRLFMPVVVLLFGLWFLLMLRFCVPSDVDLAGESRLLADLGDDPEVDERTAREVATRPSVLARVRARSGGTELVEALQDPSGSGIDPRTFASVARGMLATGPAPGPIRRFVPRVERDQVVTP